MKTIINDLIVVLSITIMFFASYTRLYTGYFGYIMLYLIVIYDFYVDKNIMGTSFYLK